MTRCYTAHLRDNEPPMLVREGFSCGALLFGPLWLARHRAWVPAALAAAAIVLILVLTGGWLAAILMLAVAVLLGLSGHDLRRWAMEHRGYLLAGVVGARTDAEALARLLARRPDLAGRFLAARHAP